MTWLITTEVSCIHIRNHAFRSNVLQIYMNYIRKAIMCPHPALGLLQGKAAIIVSNPLWVSMLEIRAVTAGQRLAADFA